MPLHLDTINRRRFFATVAGAGAGLLLPGGRWEATAAAHSGSSWALVSDTHIAGNLGRKRRGSCMASNVEKVIAEIVERDAGDAGVIVNGDCAHLFGNEKDYTSFAGLVEPLLSGRRGLHLLMGNHDDRKVFARACACAAPDTGSVPGRRTSFVPSEHANWLFLDSLDPGKWVAGKIGEPQLAWLAEMLDRHPDKPAIVVAHHNMNFDIASDQSHHYSAGGLKDTAALYELLNSRRQVKAYVFGHTHRWHLSQSREGLHFVNLPSAGYTFDRSQPSGWVNATPAANGMSVELHALDRESPEHGVKRFLRWRA